jgi:hypothetical protein
MLKALGASVRKQIVLVALLVQPLFGAAITVVVHVPVAYAHVAILIFAIPGGFFGVCSASRTTRDRRSRARR